VVRRRSSSCMSNVGRCHASLMIHVNSFVFFFFEFFYWSVFLLAALNGILFLLVCDFGMLYL